MRIYCLLLALLAANPSHALTYSISGYWSETQFSYCAGCAATTPYHWSITTDGSLGSLERANILSWEFSFSGTPSAQESELGSQGALVSSALAGAEINWQAGAEIFTEADGQLMTSARTQITFSNRFNENDLEFTRSITFSATEVAAMAFQFDHGLRFDTFGIIAASTIRADQPVLMGVAPTQNTLFSIAALNVSTPSALIATPLPGGMVLLLTAMGLLARFRSAA